MSLNTAFDSELFHHEHGPSSMSGSTYVMNNKQLQPFNRQIQNHQYHFSFILGQTAKFNSRQYFRLYGTGTKIKG